MILGLACFVHSLLPYFILYLIAIPFAHSEPLGSSTGSQILKSVQPSIGSQIVKPFKNAAHSVSTGTTKIIKNIKGAVQKGKAEMHYHSLPTHEQGIQHREKWNARIDRNSRKAENHFYDGDVHLATARSYIDQGGTIKKSVQEEKANKAQFTRHYAQSQVSYAKAIGAGSKAITAKKLRDTTYYIPGLRGH